MTSSKQRHYIIDDVTNEKKRSKLYKVTKSNDVKIDLFKKIRITTLRNQAERKTTNTLKLSCDSRFQRAFNACSCAFKVITLVWDNQGNYFENARWKRLSQRSFRMVIISKRKLKMTEIAFWVERIITHVRGGVVRTTAQKMTKFKPKKDIIRDLN